jgi:tetratricopeptide (TPR) repeat protein
MQPGDLNPYLNKGLAELYLKNWDLAIQVYSKAIELDSTNSEAFANRGVALQYQGKLKAACEDWNKALTLGSEKVKSYLQKYCSP